MARWTPRENLAEADELSRRPDASDWGIEKSTFQAVCDWFRVHPQIDLFASGVNHVVPRFVTPFYEPNCKAVHAYKLDWQSLVSADEVAWVFPPIKSVSQVTSLLQEFRVNALLCAPVLKGS